VFCLVRALSLVNGPNGEAMTLEALALGAMLGTKLLAGAGAAGEAEQTRLQPVALSIAQATEALAEKDKELFKGPSADEATALLLVAIGQRESGFREDVRRCRRTGDSGRTIGTYQLMGPWAWHGERREVICESDELQAKLALRVLSTYRGVCGPSTHRLLNAYASGTCAKSTRAARVIEDAFVALLRQHHLEVVGETARPVAKPKKASRPAPDVAQPRPRAHPAKARPGHSARPRR
jgi:hypothetical protein